MSFRVWYQVYIGTKSYQQHLKFCHSDRRKSNLFVIDTSELYSYSSANVLHSVSYFWRACFYRARWKCLTSRPSRSFMCVHQYSPWPSPQKSGSLLTNHKNYCNKVHIGIEILHIISSNNKEMLWPWSLTFVFATGLFSFQWDLPVFS